MSDATRINGVDSNVGRRLGSARERRGASQAGSTRPAPPHARCTPRASATSPHPVAFTVLTRKHALPGAAPARRWPAGVLACGFRRARTRPNAALTVATSARTIALRTSRGSAAKLARPCAARGRRLVRVDTAGGRVDATVAGIGMRRISLFPGH